MKTEGKIFVSVRPYFYICFIFIVKQKRDGKFRKRDGKRDRGNREWDGIRERVYPARIAGIPFLAGMNPYSSRFLSIRDGPNITRTGPSFIHVILHVHSTQTPTPSALTTHPFVHESLVAAASLRCCLQPPCAATARS